MKETSEEKDRKNLKKINLSLRGCFSGHGGCVTSLCLLKDGRVATGSWDKKIKILNLGSFKCDITISAHDWIVYYVSVLDSGYLVSSSGDETIKVWEIYKNRYQLIRTLRDHKKNVYKTIQISAQRMVSCSEDLTIKLWNSSSPFNCIKTLVGHNEWVNSVIELSNNNYIVSGSVDWTIRFWNQSTYKCDKVIDDVYTSCSDSLKEIKGGLLIVGGNAGLALIELSSFQVQSRIKVKSSFGYIRSILELSDGKVLFGTNNGKLVQLEERDWCCEDLEIECHSRYIDSLIMSGEILISGSEDHKVKFWKIDSI